MESDTQLRWSEQRKTKQGRTELFFVIYERTATGWQAFERSSWDVSWQQVPVKKNRLSKVKKMLGGKAA